MSLTERFQAQPRAIKWAICAGAFLVLFQVWSVWIDPMAVELRDEADTLERLADQVRASDRLQQDVRGSRRVIASLGPVESPVSINESSDAVNALVVRLLSQFSSVQNERFSASGGSDRLPVNVSADVLRGTRYEGRRLARVNAEVVFEASPTDIVGILAAFESAPEIEAVSTVRLRKSTGGRLQATLTLEAWGVQDAPRSGGAV